mgnify:CR=1 FL=1|tara:strand:+ start:670 stop:1608 length:939 start_codon:yes stop_codon:yes gene_type:complete
MAIHEIRESITQDDVVISSQDEVTYIEKVIQLQTGKRHTVAAIDVFIDNMLVSHDSDDFVYGEVLLTSQPLLLTNQALGGNYGRNTNRTPAVSVDTLLYKMIFTLPPGRGRVEPCKIEQEFPNNFLGAMPTFSWYTPRLYMYVIMYTTGNPSVISIKNLEISAYVAVDSKKASHLSYMLGNIRERSIAQIGKVMSLGRMIKVSRITGQYFPMYLFGGARSQFMMKSNALQSFYYQLEPQDAEGMLSTNEQRQFLKSARTMVPFDDAFGRNTVALGGVPDWIRSIALTGVIAGAVRDQFPPLKYADNGNTRML